VTAIDNAPARSVNTTSTRPATAHSFGNGGGRSATSAPLTRIAKLVEHAALERSPRRQAYLDAVAGLAVGEIDRWREAAGIGQ